MNGVRTVGPIDCKSLNPTLTIWKLTRTQYLHEHLPSHKKKSYRSVARSVSKVAKLRCGRPSNGGSNLGKGKRSVSSPKRPDRLWGPSSHALNGLGREAATQVYLTPKFKMDGDTHTQIHTYIYRCPRRNVPDFEKVFLMLKYTDITQNTYVQSWTVTEIMAREVWNFDSCYTLVDCQIHIKTGRNMWFL